MVRPASISVLLHGGAASPDLHWSWPALVGATAFWAVVGGGLYWYYDRRTADR